MADDRIITALDVHSLDDMKKLVETLGDSVSFYKVGMELFFPEDIKQDGIPAERSVSSVLQLPQPDCFSLPESSLYMHRELQ